MQISFRQFQHILAVARLGSFSRAAEELHISQPALSRSIAAVEDRFDVQLFERSRGAVRPTSVGVALVEQAERLMLQARSLEHNLGLWGSGQGGSIAFGMGPSAASVLMPGLLAHLATHYPSLRVTAHTNGAPVLRTELGRDEIEFLVCDRALLPADSDLVVRPIGQIRMGLFARASHPLAGRDAVLAADLQAFPLARGTMPPGFEDNSALAPLRRDASIACDNYHILREVMLVSDAIWLSAERLVAAELAAGQVVALPFGGPMSSAVDMIWLEGRNLSPAARLIADHMTRQLMA